MLRRMTAVVVAGLVLAASAPVVRAQGPVPVTPDHLRAFSVAPPGQDGNLNAQEFGSEEYGPH